MAKLDTKTSEEKAHAEYSASGSSRWLNCPGSHARSKLAPPLPESSYAAEGTTAHACFEFLLKNRRKLEAAVKVAAKTYDADMVDYALGAVEWVCAQEARHPGAEVLSETRVDASPFTCTGQFGTLDAAVVEEYGRLIVIDYKYGAGISVDPEGEDGLGNSQLVYYALGISHLYHHNFREVELVVIQPRAYHESGETVRSHVLTMGELLAWEKRFREGVFATNSPDAPLKAGKWCKFCPAAVACPELKENAMRQAQIVFTDESGVESMPEPVMVALPNLGVILDACDKLEAWIEKVRAHATHVLERGGEVGGFKLVEKRAPRKWTDEEKVAMAAKALFGAKAFTTPKLLSPAQLEKVGAEEDWIAARVTTRSSGTTMVRESDKRQAVNAIAAAFGTPLKSLEGSRKTTKGK